MNRHTHRFEDVGWGNTANRDMVEASVNHIHRVAEGCNCGRHAEERAGQVSGNGSRAEAGIQLYDRDLVQDIFYHVQGVIAQ